MNIVPGVKVFNEDGLEYEVIEFIGNGSFGDVYKIKNLNSDSEFALKTLRTPFADQIALKAFLNEGKLATGISHRNVIKYLYFHDGVKFKEFPPYIIMEYADGGTLEDILKGKKKNNNFLSADELNVFIIQLIEGMKAINEHLIHRDIKPDNILLSGGSLKITDFGLSKIVEESTRKSTFKGFGCLPYLAPEGWKFEKNTIQIDIYSMGFVFYQLATLQHPFENLDLQDVEDWRNAHLFQNVENPSNINPQLSTAVSQLIMKMQEKSVTRRYTDWSEIRATLSKDELPKTSHTEIIDSLVKNRIDKDKEAEKRRLEREKRSNQVKEFQRVIAYQFEQDIYNPLSEFIDEFNLKYEKGNIKIQRKKDSEPVCSIELLGGHRLEIRVEALIDEDFYREEVIDDYGNRLVKNELQRPHYNRKKIVAWGYAKASDKFGFNLIMVEKTNDVYGEWFILINRNHPAAKKPRLPEPFAFGLNELEKEINHLGSMHIYKTEVHSFDIKLFIEFISGYV